MSTTPDLILHVGMPRATAILVPALGRLQPQLRHHGVTMLDAASIDALPGVEGWQRDASARPRRAGAFERQLARAVAAERTHVTRRSASPVLIAHADLLGRGRLGLRDAASFRPYADSAIAHVIAALDARAVRVVLHTHRQDRLMEHAQLERILDGGSVDLAEAFPSRPGPMLDYVGLVERLAAVPGVDDVVVRPVELADAGTLAFVEDFLSTLDRAGTLDLSVVGADIPPHPRVYTEPAVALARALNPLLQGSTELALLRDFLLEHFLDDLPTTDLLDRRERASWVATYAAANRELFRRHMPDLPEDSYGDDLATFALGNVLSQPVR